MKTVIFDFDGTIADSFATLLGMFSAVTGRPQNLTPKEIDNLRSLKIGGILKYLGIKRWQIPSLGIKAKRLMTTKISGVKPFAGLDSMLAALHADSFNMYILSSNSSDNIAKFLKTNSLEGYFIKVYGDVGIRSKASALKKVMKKEKIASSDCTYVGDEVRDIEGAKKAGIKVVAVGWGFNHPTALKAVNPTALATNPQDLLKILRTF